MGWSNRPTGLTHYEPPHTYRGYTLFSPNGGDDAYLVDMAGNFVHRWHCDQGINYGFLLSNGNLLFRTKGSIPGRPASDAIVEVDWDGNPVWEYRNPNLRRHCRLSNGNNLFLIFDPISEEMTQQVRGGFTSPTDPAQMIGDLVVETNPAGDVVHEWRSSEYLDPASDIICPLENRASWGGANDISAIESNDDWDGNFLISFRILDTVAVVDRSTGDFVWKWGAGEISHQHHPTFLTNGHVLMLDNGAHRRGLSYSRVIEVDPEINEIVWQYRGTPLNSFFTHFTGGAQRLENGNTLITEGANGRLFEITPNGEVVWEYISPFFAQDLTGVANGVFRAHRYGPEHPALVGKDLDPERYGNLNRLYGGGR
jgi:hypothetical protein